MHPVLAQVVGRALKDSVHGEYYFVVQNLVNFSTRFFPR